MNPKILVTYISLLFAVLLTFSNGQSQSVTASGIKQVNDQFRQDFWMESAYALGKDYLIKVRLPSDYYNTDKIYPVMYLTDADWYFGIASDIAHHLEINSKEIILVGISYGTNHEIWDKRFMDFTADFFSEDGTPGFALFLSFFEKELFPEIESRFRADHVKRTLFGWSSGFYFGCHTLYEKRSLFDSYILGGGTFPQDWPTTMKLKDRASLKEKRSTSPISIFVGNPESNSNQEQMLESIGWLEAQDFADFAIEWKVYDGMGHTIHAVMELLFDGMESTFMEKSIVPVFCKVLNEKGIDEAIDKYLFWKKNNPELFDFDPSELKEVARRLGERGKTQEQSELLAFVAKEFPTRKIEFVVTSILLPESEIIYITGNHDVLGNWNPSAIPLKKHRDGSWHGTFQIEENTDLEYKVTLGSWEKEALTKEGNIPSNYLLEVKDDTVVKIEIFKWQGLK